MHLSTTSGHNTAWLTHLFCSHWRLPEFLPLYLYWPFLSLLVFILLVFVFSCATLLLNIFLFLKWDYFWGARVAQLVKCLTSAQVMISRFMSLSPTSGSVLTARSLEPASDSVSLSLSLPLPCLHSVSLPLSKIIKNIFKKLKERCDELLFLSHSSKVNILGW